MYYHRIIAVGLLSAVTSFAQTAIDLQGKVTNTGGTALPGVELQLLAAGLNTTSDANGDYAFVSASAVSSRPASISGLHYSAGVLSFRQAANQANVRIDLLSLQGKLLRRLVSGKLERGMYSIGIGGVDLAPQMYILRADINRQIKYLPVSLVGDLGGAALSRVGDAGIMPLSKTAAVIDTLTARLSGYGVTKIPVESYTGVMDVILSALSSWDGDTNAFWGPRGDQIPLPQNAIIYKFLNRTNGAWSDEQIWWEAGGQIHNLAEQDYYDMGNGSGRVNFYIGESKAAARYMDFIEHTIGGAWNGNTTRVDWYGFPIAIRLHGTDGYDRILGENYDVFYMGREKFFELYKASVPEKFVHLAEVEGDRRIVCPGSGEFKPTGLYKDYYTAYVDSVWEKNGLTVAKPNVEQIFRCAGEAVGGDPQLCGALNRHMGMYTRVFRDAVPPVGQRDSTWWDVNLFYQAEPANFYAAFLHEHSFENLAYGFAYDDDADQQAFMAHGNMHYLLVAIGF